MVWEWILPFYERVSDDGGPKTRDEFVAREMARAAAPLYETWGVWRDGELGGLVTFERADARAPAGWTHALFKQAFFGWKTTIPALRLVYGELFGRGVETIRGEVFEKNSAMIALARRLGAKTYSVPKATLKGGQAINLTGLVLTKERFHAVSGSDSGVSGNHRGSGVGGLFEVET